MDFGASPGVRSTSLRGYSHYPRGSEYLIPGPESVSALQEHPDHQQLAAFLWGQLDDSEQSAIESHIADCAACCKILQEIPDNTMLGRLRGAEAPSNSGPVAGSNKDLPLPRELRDHPRYKVGRFLGAGGMGLVYQAEHRVMERPVALKIIHRDLIRHPRAIDRFHQEVKAAARLSHPNIVTAYDAEQAGETHFLVMEYVDGINLARLVAKRGPLGVAHACNYIRQAALGLQHAFENGMVHRDIKPHNLMLTRKGQIKILDFGLARLASESAADLELPTGKSRPGLTSAGDVIGTPDYMAPEQSVDSRHADIRADLYSLGCTFYFLLVGQTPFVEGSSATKVFSHRYLQPQPVSELRDDLPAEVAAILKKLMAKDPGQRYQTPAELVKVLTPLGKPGPTFSMDTTPVKEASAAPETGVAATNVVALTKASEPARPARGEASKGFPARCPYCPARVWVPAKAIGASIRCAQCASYFTAVPEEDSTPTPTPSSGGSTKPEAAGNAATFAGEKKRSSGSGDRVAPGVAVNESIGGWNPAVVTLAGIGLAATVVLMFIHPAIALAALLLVLILLLIWKTKSN